MPVIKTPFEPYETLVSKVLRNYLESPKEPSLPKKMLKRALTGKYGGRTRSQKRIDQLEIQLLKEMSKPGGGDTGEVKALKKKIEIYRSIRDLSIL